MRRQYPRYRNSGVEWLGPVPVHWQVKRLKNICKMQAGNGITAESIEPSGEYPVFGGNGLRGYTFQYTHEGDFILIGRQGALCGNVFIAKGRLWASEHAVVTTLDSPHVIGWFAAALTAMNLNQYSVSAAQPGLSVERVLTLLIPLPPLDEQHAIAKYLDRETEHIDKLVAKHRLLIERLAEYRTALITRTVTQGLPPEATRAAGIDPSPQLKPSGVEWLGDVPEHWEVRRIRSAVDLRVSNVNKKINDGELSVRLCNYVDVYKSERITADIPFMQATATASEIARFRLELGDVLITKDSETWDDIGVPSLVEYTASDVVCGYHLALLRSLESLLDGRFLLRVLQSSAVGSQFNVSASGVTRYGLTQEAIKSTLLPIPPLEEQHAIVAFLDRETERIDSLSCHVETAIERLQEYRTSLITAAVTGKIDVRERSMRKPCRSSCR